jgi:outer membrane protein
MTARTALLAVAAGWAIAAAAPAQDRETRVVFVHLDRAFNEYYKTKMADAQLKAQAAEFNQERKALVDRLQQAQAEFNALREEAQNPALTDEVRAQKRALGEEKLVAIRESESAVKRFDELRTKQLDDQSRRMRRSIVDDIRETVRSYARLQGLDGVIDSSGQSFNGVETVLFVERRSDITDTIIGILNKGMPAEAATPGAAPAVTAPDAAPGGATNAAPAGGGTATP